MCAYVFDLIQSFTLSPLPTTTNVYFRRFFSPKWHVFIYLRREFPFHLLSPPLLTPLLKPLLTMTIRRRVRRCAHNKFVRCFIHFHKRFIVYSQVGEQIVCRCSISADVLYIISYHPNTVHSSINHWRDDSYEFCNHGLYFRHLVCSCLIKEN